MQPWNSNIAYKDKEKLQRWIKANSVEVQVQCTLVAKNESRNHLRIKEIE